ncbi:MAG TPA: amidohydrolase family protein [Candidatus Baltobacteraceae bacterium]|jgi:cytosine/adenosine deaminase-related metal-dependent hydrolase|nr:amidohydrolase family protein [Candidatus Baltobacteraceae bacterium]
MIIRARIVVTMDGPPIENGAIAISKNQIIDVGKFPEISARHSGLEVVDLGERALLPGLINAHCHLDYTCLRGKIRPQKSFTDWIRAINTEKSKLSRQDYLVSIAEGFAEAKRFGTTTVANLTAFPELISEIQTPIRTWWFAELIDVRSPERANEIVDRAIESLEPAENRGLAPHAPFTASSNLYRLCEEVARRQSILLTTHLAESREELEMFRNQSGPLYEFMKSIGRPMDDCGQETPLAFFANIAGAPPSTSLRAGSGRALPNEWIVAHLNELAESGFKLLKESTNKFHLVHCPRSHDYFGHSRFRFEKLRGLGFNICLGTDSLASNEDLSLFAEMRAFQRSESGISPDKILELVTVNAARSLHQENALGRIRPGFRADLIAIPYGGHADLFEQIVAFAGSIDWMTVNGRMKMTKLQ